MEFVLGAYVLAGLIIRLPSSVSQYHGGTLNPANTEALRGTEPQVTTLMHTPDSRPSWHQAIPGAAFVLAWYPGKVANRKAESWGSCP